MDPTAAESRLFTLDGANALLPHVRELLEAIQGRAAQLGELQGRLGAFREEKQRTGHALERESRLVQDALAEANRISAEIKEVLEELRSFGCELKDVQLGLVDFRALREGRTVYLCWRQGEDEIRFWHELDTGFTGRKPL